MSDSSVTANLSDAIADDGTASVNSGVAVLDFSGNPRQVTFRDVVISGNRGLARSRSGASVSAGGGIFTNALLDLHGVVIRNNSVTALGPRATAQGGGIWNGVALSGPPVVFTMDHSAVKGNVAAGSVNALVEGGGLYTNQPVTITRSTIAKNRPDQCFGCVQTGLTHNTRLTPMPSGRS